jgi:DNA-binding transcriptional MerR regulator
MDTTTRRGTRTGQLPRNLPPIPGATYRQIGYWAKQGYLRPDKPRGEGSGNPRAWPAEEIRVAQLMARLVDAGLPPELAHRIARGENDIAPGVRVLVDVLESSLQEREVSHA